MKIVVFTGPTLSAEEGRAMLDATFLPPAAQGDVFLAARDRPAAIGIIDGYFDRVSGVSHKEILWAMARGVHVLGAASMGALRAAELSMFGMEGVGEIYEDFARGEPDADDEVAVAHASAEEGYRVTSEAMVNIRTTLRAAERAGVISAEGREELVRIGRDLFYPDRCYPILLARATEEGVLPDVVEALRRFLREGGRVDQKRLDALALLRALGERLARGCDPKRVGWHFEPTDAWEQIRERAQNRASGAGQRV